MLKATYSNQYRKADASGKRFVYHVTGNPDELEQFKKIMSAKGAYAEDEESGNPLYWITEFLVIPGQRPVRQRIRNQFTLAISQKGDKIFIDDSKDTMQLHDAVNNIDLLAQAIRQKMADEWVNGNSAAPVQTPVKKDVKTNEETPEETLRKLKQDTEKGPETEKIEGPEAADKTVGAL